MGPNGAVCPGPVFCGRVGARSRTATARIRGQIHVVRRLRSLSASTLRALHAQTSNGEERVRYDLDRSPVSAEIRSRAISRDLE